MILKILLHILTIIPMAIVKYGLTILGWLVVPIALLKTTRHPDTTINDSNGQLLWIKQTLAKWAWLWDNDSDGTLGDKRGWWRLFRCGGNPESFWNQFAWLALRNPVNNLQRVPPLYANGKELHEEGVEYIGDERVDDDVGGGGWHFCWSGWRTGFYLIYEYTLINPILIKHGFKPRALEIRTGWKIRPLPQKDKAVGFTVLPHPWRRL